MTGCYSCLCPEGQLTDCSRCVALWLIPRLRVENIILCQCNLRWCRTLSQPFTCVLVTGTSTRCGVTVTVWLVPSWPSAVDGTWTPWTNSGGFWESWSLEFPTHPRTPTHPPPTRPPHTHTVACIWVTVVTRVGCCVLLRGGGLPVLPRPGRSQYRVPLLPHPLRPPPRPAAVAPGTS